MKIHSGQNKIFHKSFFITSRPQKIIPPSPKFFHLTWKGRRSLRRPAKLQGSAHFARPSFTSGPRAELAADSGRFFFAIWVHLVMI